MTISSNWPVPYLLAPQHLAVDAVTAFCVSVLVAITINAEAQAFAATFLGDARTGDPHRFNFNAFLKLDILGTICYLAAGFGWPRTLDINPAKFAHPRFYMVLARAAGPVANLLMASIAGSIAMIMKSVASDPRVFLMVVGVNITTAIYNLIPLPPLAAGFLVQELIPLNYSMVRLIFTQAGPFLILALALTERITGHGIFSPYLTPMIVAVFDFIQG